MCSRYSLMNRHLPKLLMMLIARIILNAGATRQGPLRRTGSWQRAAASWHTRRPRAGKRKSLAKGVKTNDGEPPVSVKIR